MEPAAFLDRDGVVNRDIGYLHRPEDVEFIRGIFEVVAGLRARGYRPVVVTNQSGIARGFYTEGDFNALMDWMRARFAEAGAPLDAVYYCPHHPEDGEPPYRRNCECRKPAPGMLQQAARELDLDLSRSLLIGDSERDIEAGRAAGVARTFLLAPASTTSSAADHVVTRLSDIEDILAGH
ncbi:MAG: D-glycero-beta-D-manno-heptose 1,7-bisphosphate 7-phosphatase [Pseudomonadota bacterium]